MSYELILGIARITGRTLILNKSDFVGHLAGLPKTEWLDIWPSLNKQELLKRFDVIEANAVPDLDGRIELMSSYHSHTFNAPEALNDVYSYKLNDLSHVDQVCFVNDIRKYRDEKDFQLFTSGRDVIDLDRPEKFLHFEANLFGYYWYQIYPGGPQERNALKDNVNSVMNYNDRFNPLLENCLSIIGAPFNAVHLRRNDFFGQYLDSMKSVSTIQDLTSQLKLSFSNNIPLYIATDEQDKDFFLELKKYWKIFTFDDLKLNVSKLDAVILEQLICAKAQFFLGTLPSTFSKRINVIRGLNGLHVNDHIGVNLVGHHGIKFSSPLPWIDYENHSKRWHWFSSCHPHWTLEST